MRKLFFAVLVLVAGQSSHAAIVASQVSCQTLKASVAAGETEVIGKTGKIYPMVSDCAQTHWFKTQTGLCLVWVQGIYDCTPSYGDNGGGGA